MEAYIAARLFGSLFPKEYDDYVTKLISVIYKQTNGEINLQTPDSNNPKKLKTTMEKREREVRTARAEKDWKRKKRRKEVWG